MNFSLVTREHKTCVDGSEVHKFPSICHFSLPLSLSTLVFLSRSW